MRCLSQLLVRRLFEAAFLIAWLVRKEIRWLDPFLRELCSFLEVKLMINYLAPLAQSHRLKLPVTLDHT